MRRKKILFVFILFFIVIVNFAEIVIAPSISYKPLAHASFKVNNTFKSNLNLYSTKVSTFPKSFMFKHTEENADVLTSLNWSIETMNVQSILSNIIIYYPKSNNETIDNLVKSELDKLIDTFNQNVEIINKSPNFPSKKDLGKLFIDFRIFKSENTVSIVFNKIEYYINNTEVNNTYFSYTFNLLENIQFDLKDIFKDPNYLNTLNENLELNDSENITLNEGNISSWALSNSDLILYTNNSELTPNIFGFKKITMPFEKLNDKLSLPKPKEEIIDKSNDEVIEKNYDILPLNTDSSVKYVALTFDDGPSTLHTPRLLDALDQYNAKATFFLLGNRISYSQDIVKRMSEAGHEVGNHTTWHKNLTTLSNENITSEITGTNDLIVSITGNNATVLRPPYGSHNENVDNIIRGLGNSVMLWNVDPQDWKYKDSNIVYNNIASKMNDGDIILLHDIHSSSVDAAIRILQDFSDKGYKFVTVSELAAIKGRSLDSGTVYSGFK